MRLPIAVGALAAIAAGASAFAQGISDPGERAFQYCFSCHSVEPNQTEVLSGPNLNGVIGRPIASKAGFQYSDAMKSFGAGKAWTPELIENSSRTRTVWSPVPRCRSRPDRVTQLSGQRFSII